jgi:hypothetical protein
MNPGVKVLVVFAAVAVGLMLYLAFEVLIFRLSCRVARVPRPGMFRSIGIVLVAIFCISAAEGVIGAVIREVYVLGNYPLWEAGLVAFFLGLPIHMLVASIVHAKMLGLQLSEGMAVWFIEKAIKLGLFTGAIGLIGLLVLLAKVKP